MHHESTTGAGAAWRVGPALSWFICFSGHLSCFPRGGGTTWAPGGTASLRRPWGMSAGASKGPGTLPGCRFPNQEAGDSLRGLSPAGEPSTRQWPQNGGPSLESFGAGSSLSTGTWPLMCLSPHPRPHLWGPTPSPTSPWGRHRSVSCFHGARTKACSKGRRAVWTGTRDLRTGLEVDVCREAQVVHYNHK